ncbi:conserved membrane protein of unknown function [Burkholderia multivorans]
MTLTHALRLVTQTAVALPLAGCALAPSLPVFGAAFPGWLFCLAGGIAATLVVHLMLARRGMREMLAPLAVSYVAMSGLFAMAAWLIFFSH